MWTLPSAVSERNAIRLDFDYPYWTILDYDDDDGGDEEELSQWLLGG
jgi:hypothetical protein